MPCDIVVSGQLFAKLKEKRTVGVIIFAGSSISYKARLYSPIRISGHESHRPRKVLRIRVDDATIPVCRADSGGYCKLLRYALSAPRVEFRWR